MGRGVWRGLAGVIGVHAFSLYSLKKYSMLMD